MMLNSRFLSLKSTLFPLEPKTRHEQVPMFQKLVLSQRFISTRAARSKLPSPGNRQKHFVLVHGACHGAWCWYKVSALLKAAGHNVTALDMGASGVHPKQVHEIQSFADYYEPLTELMASLPSEERVVLVGHSMSGIIISIAMERFHDKIAAGVFVAANMPGPHFSFKTIAEKYAQRGISSMDTQIVFGNGPDKPPTATVLGPNYMATKMYYRCPPEDLVLATLLVRPFPLAATPAEVVVTEEKYGTVSRVYIVCDHENNEMQRWMIENNPPNEVYDISDASDHMVMLSKPHKFCSCLQEIGSKYF